MENLFKRSEIDWERFRNKTIFITGAYGMLPAYMVYMFIYLNERHDSFNIKIIACCRNRDKSTKRFKEYTNKQYFQLYINDVCEKLIIDEKIDFIIHAASPASSQYYSTNPVDVLLPNVLGTYNSLELARNNSVEGYLYFSSGEIYGKIEKELIFEDDSGYMNPVDVRSC
jgi:nucleoside-diphosphate-sugar epimerase